MKERLQKYMAKCGVASRRKSEEIISQGRVSVNGEIVNEIVMIDEEIDNVKVDGQIIALEEKKVYIILNKPVGVITSVKDQFDRRTVTEIVNIKERVYPVGRLDYDTSGLLLMTNDGDIAYKMTHPSHEIEKVYSARIKGIPTIDEIEKFKSGLKIEDYITAPSDIKILSQYGNSSLVQITIHEGRNRQVRKMCDAINHPVLELKRIMIGEIELGNLKSGEWRELTEEEVGYLNRL
jgi:23S rRNA pseudouridine2605 synthase